MLRNPILGMETQDDVNRNNNIRSIETKHGLITNWSSIKLEKSFISKYRLGTPKILNKSVPRRNKNLFRYKMQRSLSCDIINPRKHDLFKLQNLSLDSSSLGADNSPRELSRSAKIMRALSSNHKLFRYESTKNVKKSLNFDLTPSPKKYNNFDENQSDTSSKMSTPSNILDESLRYDTSSTDSSTSILITSSKSIDENQNQTPQHNRKLGKIVSNTDTTKNWIKFKLPTSTSLLRSELKKRIDNIVSNTSSLETTKPLKQDNKTSQIFENVTTPNISRTWVEVEEEFSKFRAQFMTENFIGERRRTRNTINDIFKRRSFRKGGSSCHGEKPLTKNMNSLITSDTTEPLRLDSETNNIGTSTKQSQVENKIVRKMLFCDSEDELPDIESGSHCIDKREIISRRKKYNLSIEGLDKSRNYKIKSIDLSDLETYEQNIQDSNNSHFVKHKNNKDDIDKNMCCNKKECLLHSQRTNSNNDEMHEDKSLELDQAVTQDLGIAVTPKNRRNMHCLLTESIKKSHKKSKGKDKKPPLEPFQQIKSDDILSQNDQNDEECEDIIKNKAADTSCTLNSQNAARSSTPENINSTRLLLPQFSSIKKSHKKDKRSKKCSDLLKHCAYTKDIMHLENKEYETDTGETLCKYDTCQFKKSSNMSHNEKEGNSMNIFMQKLPNPSESVYMDVGYEPINNEFKIYTPIRRKTSSVAINITNCTHTRANETLPEKNNHMEINLSRCITPVSRCFVNRKSREEKCFDAHLDCMNVKSDNEVSRNEATNSTNEDGRSTPVNISTSELFCDIESIKKSHKKNKVNSKIRKREILKRKQSYVEETSSNSIHNATDNKKYEDIFYNDARPSTSRGNDSDIESVRYVKSSKHLNTTPPNSLKTLNFMKRLNSTSIKTLHKKDRNKNAQEKYILMTKEHELSDDGSIYDEKDRLSSENSDPYQEIDKKKNNA